MSRIRIDHGSLLRASLASTPSENPSFVAAYSEGDTLGQSAGFLTGTMNRTLVDSPANPGSYRVLETLIIVNTSSSAIELTLEIYDGTTSYLICNQTIRAGYKFTGEATYDSSGGLYTSGTGGGGGGGGTVTSVNAVDPDESGNVALALSDLGAQEYLSTPGANGLILEGNTSRNFTWVTKPIGTVISVNGVTPSAGNVVLDPGDIGAESVIANGTAAGQVFTWNGAAKVWIAPAVSSVNSQTGAVSLTAANVGAEPTLGNGTVSGQVLTWNGSAKVWATPSTGSGGTVNSVNGITPVSGNVTLTASDVGAASRLLTENAQTGTSYTLALSDQWVTMDNPSASVLTIPSNASVAFPVGIQIPVTQIGAGQLSFAPASGVTILNTKRKVIEQTGTIVLIQRTTNVWLLVGGLTA